MISQRRFLGRAAREGGFHALGDQRKRDQRGRSGGEWRNSADPDGAVGDASKGTADKGRQAAEHQVDGFVALLRDMSAFHLSRLFEPQG